MPLWAAYVKKHFSNERPCKTKCRLTNENLREADNLRVCKDEEGDEHCRDREEHAESRDQRIGGTPNGGHGAQALGEKRAARHAEHTTEARHHSEHQRNTRAVTHDAGQGVQLEAEVQIDRCPPESAPAPNAAAVKPRRTSTKLGVCASRRRSESHKSNLDCATATGGQVARARRCWPRRRARPSRRERSRRQAPRQRRSCLERSEQQTCSRRPQPQRRPRALRVRWRLARARLRRWL